MNWPITLPSGKRMNLSLVMFAMPRADNGKTAAWFGGGDDDLLTIEGSDWPAFCAAWAEYEAACRERYGRRERRVCAAILHQAVSSHKESPLGKALARCEAAMKEGR